MTNLNYDELAEMYRTAQTEIARLQTRLDAVRTIVGDAGGSLKTELVFYDERGDMWTEAELNELLKEHDEKEDDGQVHP